MSRWWADLARRQTLRVELRPAELRLSRGQVVRVHAIPLLATNGLGGPLDEMDEPWRPGLDALAVALKAESPAPRRVAVVLSDHFVRYVLLPWDESLIGDAERLAFARHAFRELYGAGADEWEVCLDEQPAGQRFFAAAVDRALVSGLTQVVSHLGVRLAAVTPALADCINRHRQVLTETESCLAMFEAGRVSFAFRGRRGWAAVRSRRLDGPLAEAFPTLLKQEAVAASVTDAGVLYLCAADAAELGTLTVPGWRLVRLAGDRTQARGLRRVQPSLLSRLQRSR